MLAVLMAMAGCDCFRFAYVSFEHDPEFEIVERSTRIAGAGTLTFPRLPTKYRVTRRGYYLEVSSGGRSYPMMAIRAFDESGNPLEILGPDMGWRYGPRIAKGIEEGEWSFDVLRGDERIGHETFRYRVRSRPIACQFDQ